MTQVVAAHDNGCLSIYDYNSNKVVKQINEAHKDGISSLLFSNSGLHLITGCHDGSIKVWDIRTLQSIGEAKLAHGRKYDEGVLCLQTHPTVPFFASGGADSTVNIYELYV